MVLMAEYHMGMFFKGYALEKMPSFLSGSSYELSRESEYRFLSRQ